MSFIFCKHSSSVAHTSISLHGFTAPHSFSYHSSFYPKLFILIHHMVGCILTSWAFSPPPEDSEVSDSLSFWKQLHFSPLNCLKVEVFMVFLNSSFSVLYHVLHLFPTWAKNFFETLRLQSQLITIYSLNSWNIYLNGVYRSRVPLVFSLIFCQGQSLKRFIWKRHWKEWYQNIHTVLELAFVINIS